MFQVVSAQDMSPLPQNRAFDITGTGVQYGFGSATPTEMGRQRDEYQCVTDGPDRYGNNEQATITVRRNGAINSEGAFNTEDARYDFLAIGGIRYGGSNAPMNVEVNWGDSFTWTSDSAVTRHGWTVCLEEYVAPTTCTFPSQFMNAVGGCETVSTCSSQQYQTAAPSPSSDRECETVSTCSSQQYQTRMPLTGPYQSGVGRDRECEVLTVCEANEYESVPPTATSDRVCAELTCARIEQQWLDNNCCTTSQTRCEDLKGLYNKCSEC